MRSPVNDRWQLRFYAPLFAFLITGGTGEAQMQDSRVKSIKYVQGLEPGCTLDHGYRCISVEEDDFLSPDTDQRLIPAVYLGAWMVSYADFKALDDLSDAQKELRHYKVGFTENEDDYVILLQALLMPEIVDGVPVGLTRSTFGQSMKYRIDRKTLAIKERLFLK